MEALYGSERAHILQTLGLRDLESELSRLAARPKDQVLAIDLTGRDPDDGATQVPYEKGALFLRTLEEAVGRPAFDRWLRGYFDRHAFQSITTAQCLSDLRSRLLAAESSAPNDVPIDDWVFGPGIPAGAARGTSRVFDDIEARAAAFAGGSPLETRTAEGWSPQEWVHFLRSLPDDLGETRLVELDRTFALSVSANSEILFAWLRLAIAHRHEPALPALARFLTSQGRRKFLKPLYEDLMKSEWGRPRALKLYARARPHYHAVSARTIDEIVGSPR
jgi:leukotriene-A4 hydrolase